MFPKKIERIFGTLQAYPKWMNKETNDDFEGWPILSRIVPVITIVDRTNYENL